ncbi:hypothetical protein EFA69_02675 [Rufibacter immobilis]|uniref:Uncharacterized protein n=1 Tax=Rufibacter immobilis TaxID=1348778 RepID=A0A3M9N361_9BACT|nr:hypothetical protein [Rufibacter immobilis]RNI32250.1 hypothetical protein EFA69_02675 [Rufibacter immobilis]
MEKIYKENKQQKLFRCHLESGGSPVKYYSKATEGLRPIASAILADAGIGDRIEEGLMMLEMMQPFYCKNDLRYVNIHSNRFVKYFGSNDKRSYTHLIRAFTKAGLIEPFRGSSMVAKLGNGSYTVGYKTKAYRITPQYWDIVDKSPVSQIKFKHSFNMAFKIWNEQDEQKREILIESKRRKLTENTIAICSGLDSKQAWTDINIIYNKDSEAKFKKHPVADTLRFVNRLADGWYYEMCYDEFGHRYHSPLTNSIKQVREYVRFNGKPAMEIDFKNSQYYFFALAATYPDIVYNILTEGEDEAQDSNEVMLVLSTIKLAYKANQDFREFCKQALAGNLYEWMVEELTSKGIRTDRDKVKKMLMPGLMSDELEAKKIKRKLGLVIPSVIEVCGILNRPEENRLAEWKAYVAEVGDMYSYPQLVKLKKQFYRKRNLIPKLLQRLETRIIIDRIAVEAIAEGAKLFTTIHDSFLTHQDNKNLFFSLISRWFSMMGVAEQDHPKVKEKVFRGWNCGCGQKGCACSYWTEVDLAGVPLMYAELL